MIGTLILACIVAILAVLWLNAIDRLRRTKRELELERIYSERLERAIGPDTFMPPRPQPPFVMT